MTCISENVYEFKRYNNITINKIISSIPEKDKYITCRDILRSIVMNTRNKYHKFSGFVNTKNKNRLTLCNIFWNKNVYVSNHVNIFNSSENINVGDFIEFYGKIYEYDRANNTEDIGIQIIKITNKIKSDFTINIEDQIEENDINVYIDNLSYDMLEWFYEIQITNIKNKLIYQPYIKAEMFESILETIYYEETKEYEMITNKLSLTLNCDIVKWICFIRYLIVELDITSPFIIYTILCNLIRRKDGYNLNKKFENIRRYSFNNIKLLNLDIKKLMKNYMLSLNNYINQFKITIGEIVDDGENE